MSETSMLLVAPPYTIDPSSAVSRHARRLVHALAERSRSSVLCAADSREDRAGALRTFRCDGVSIHTINRAVNDGGPLFGRYDSPVATSAFDRLLSAERPDVIHVHDLASIGLGLLDAANRRRIPVVMTLGDAWLACPRRTRRAANGTACHVIDRSRCVACLRATDATLFPGGAHRLRVMADREAVATWEERTRSAIRSIDRFIVADHASRDAWIRYGIPADCITVIPRMLFAQVEAVLRSSIRRRRDARAPHRGTVSFGDRFRRDVARVAGMSRDELLGGAKAGLRGLSERLRLDASRVEALCEFGAHARRVGEAYRIAEAELEWLRNERAQLTAEGRALRSHNADLQLRIEQMSRDHESLKRHQRGLERHVRHVEAVTRLQAEEAKRTEQYALELERWQRLSETRWQALTQQFGKRRTTLDKIVRSRLVQFLGRCIGIRASRSRHRDAPRSTTHPRPESLASAEPTPPHMPAA